MNPYRFLRRALPLPQEPPNGAAAAQQQQQQKQAAISSNPFVGENENDSDSDHHSSPESSHPTNNNPFDSSEESLAQQQKQQQHRKSAVADPLNNNPFNGGDSTAGPDVDPSSKSNNEDDDGNNNNNNHTGVCPPFPRTISKNPFDYSIGESNNSILQQASFSNASNASKPGFQDLRPNGTPPTAIVELPAKKKKPKPLTTASAAPQQSQSSPRRLSAPPVTPQDSSASSSTGTSDGSRSSSSSTTPHPIPLTISSQDAWTTAVNGGGGGGDHDDDEEQPSTITSHTGTTVEEPQQPSGSASDSVSETTSEVAPQQQRGAPETTTARMSHGHLVYSSSNNSKSMVQQHQQYARSLPQSSLAAQAQQPRLSTESNGDNKPWQQPALRPTAASSRSQMTWHDGDRFPIQEIERIKNKTRQLRRKHQREDEQAAAAAATSRQIFRPYSSPLDDEEEDDEDHHGEGDDDHDSSPDAYVWIPTTSSPTDAVQQRQQSQRQLSYQVRIHDETTYRTSAQQHRPRSISPPPVSISSAASSTTPSVLKDYSRRQPHRDINNHRQQQRHVDSYNYLRQNNDNNNNGSLSPTSPPISRPMLHNYVQQQQSQSQSQRSIRPNPTMQSQHTAGSAASAGGGSTTSYGHSVRQLSRRRHDSWIRQDDAVAESSTSLDSSSRMGPTPRAAQAALLQGFEVVHKPLKQQQQQQQEHRSNSAPGRLTPSNNNAKNNSNSTARNLVTPPHQRHAAPHRRCRSPSPPAAAAWHPLTPNVFMANSNKSSSKRRPVIDLVTNDSVLDQTNTSQSETSRTSSAEEENVSSQHQETDHADKLHLDPSHDSTQTNKTASSSINLDLHDLVSESVQTDDVAWRNALYLLSVQPDLATVQAPREQQHWTPLHLICLQDAAGAGSSSSLRGISSNTSSSTMTGAPRFVWTALLYAGPSAAATPDAGGRLPLHLLAATLGNDHPAIPAQRQHSIDDLTTRMRSTASTMARSNIKSSLYRASSGIISTPFLPRAAPTAAMAGWEMLDVLIQAYPAALIRPDAAGYIPLHLLLRNTALTVSARHVRLLLGIDVTKNEVVAGGSGGGAAVPWDQRTNASTKSASRSATTSSDGARASSASSSSSLSNVTLMRRRHHLDMTLSDLQDWMDRRSRPVVTRFYDRLVAEYEIEFVSYPPDVQLALKKLSHWRRKQSPQQQQRQQQHEQRDQQQQQKSNPGKVTWRDRNAGGDDDLGKTVFFEGEDDGERERDDDYDDDRWMNPAAIPTPNSGQLPIHMVLHRAIVDQVQRIVSVTSSSFQDDNDDEDEEEVEDVTDDAEGKDHEKGIPGGFKKKGQKKKKKGAKGKPQLQTAENEPNMSGVMEIIRLLITAYPASLLEEDGFGLTPLLTVLLVRDSIPSLDLVEMLLGKRTLPSCFESLPSWAHDLPLHLYHNDLDRLASTTQVLNPAMIPVPETGQLPLHVVADEWPEHADLLETIAESYPAAVMVQDDGGRTPLHLALGNYRRIAISPGVLRILYTDRVAQIHDHQGNLPLDLLLDSARHLPRRMPESWGANPFPVDDVPSTASGKVHILGIYQQLIESSVQAVVKTSKPDDLRKVLHRLRPLPPWLRQQACANSVVQQLILDALSKPHIFALILLDGVMLVAVIIFFRLQLDDFFRASSAASDYNLSEWYSYAVYCTATVRIVMHVGLSGLSASTRDFAHLYWNNAWFWIDAAAMIMTIVTSIYFYKPLEVDLLLSLATFSTALQWSAALGFLGTWWYGMAVFVGCLFQVASSLFWPAIASGILIVGFAQMLYSLLQTDDCIDTLSMMSDQSLCGIRASYRIIYMLIRGESLADMLGSSPMEPGLIVLFVAFLALFLLLVLGLLVVLLSAPNRGLDVEQIALATYWEPRLAFVLSDSLGIRTLDGWDNYLARAWDRFTRTWGSFGEDRNRRSFWYAHPRQSMSSNIQTCVASVVIIPVWLICGFASLGLLWPPQVRRFVLHPFGFHHRVKSRETESSTARVHESGNMRQELHQMKLMTFDRTGNVERELRDLKNLLYMAMKE